MNKLITIGIFTGFILILTGMIILSQGKNQTFLSLPYKNLNLKGDFKLNLIDNGSGSLISSR